MHDIPFSSCNISDIVIKYQLGKIRTNFVDGDNPQKSKFKDYLKPLWFLATVGWYVVLSLIIPTAIGFWMDQPQQFNSRPLYTLIGLGIGTVIAFVGLYRMLKQFYKKQKEIWNNTKKETKE